MILHRIIIFSRAKSYIEFKCRDVRTIQFSAYLHNKLFTNYSDISGLPHDHGKASYDFMILIYWVITEFIMSRPQFHPIPGHRWRPLYHGKAFVMMAEFPGGKE